MTAPQHTDRAVESILARPYARVLERSPEGGYTAYVVEFPGCFSEGDTAEEAIINVDEALAGIVAVLLEEGDEIPLPLSAREYGGRVLLRLSSGLHRQAVTAAAVEDISLNRLLCDAVAQYLGAPTRQRGGASVARRLRRRVGVQPASPVA